jgi:hypothetical protein
VTVGARLVTLGTIAPSAPRLEREVVEEGGVVGENERPAQARITNSVMITPAASQYHHRSLKPDDFIFTTASTGT